MKKPVDGMNLRDAIIKHPVFIYLTALAVGFTAGMGAFELIMRIAQLDLVQKNLYIMRVELAEKYVAKSEFESLQQQYQLLLRENQRLNQSNPRNQTNVADIREKRRYSGKLQELIDEGSSYYRGSFKDFNFENWRDECTYLLDAVDRLLGTTYKSEFSSVTSHPRSKVFLDHQSVGRSLVILNTVKDIITF